MACKTIVIIVSLVFAVGQAFFGSCSCSVLSDRDVGVWAFVLASACRVLKKSIRFLRLDVFLNSQKLLRIFATDGSGFLLARLFNYWKEDIESL